MLINVLRHKSIDPEIKEIAEKYANNPEAVLDVLLDIHSSRGSVNKEAVNDAARALRIPAHLTYGISTFYSMLQTPTTTVRVCDGPACWLKGAADVVESLRTKDEQGDLNIDRSSCLGLCDLAPALLIGEKQAGPFDTTLGADLGEFLGENIPKYEHPLSEEVRVLLKDAEFIDPDSIDSAIEFGAYQALKMALTEGKDKIIDELETSGLRGRGGAGFPVGKKWRFVAEASSKDKYIICNADESEPLTFKDRVLMDANPHKILEGILLAGYAVGAQSAFIYIRGEYSSQTRKLEAAIKQAEEKGWIGNNIQGSDFSFSIHLHRGAGAYVCGEETALIESLEGKRGEPRIRPPYPASYGYHGKPTVVNNVESFAYVPEIIKNGGNWYRKIGNPKIPGTKLYTILGDVNRPGLFEAPFGITLQEAIEEFGEGMTPGSEFHFALTGGAAGTIVSSEFLDLPIGSSQNGEGISLGSGGMLICDQSVNPIEILREVMFFFESESCGKCTPCRVGTRDARMILDRMVAGNKTDDDREDLLNLAGQLKETSFCGLGLSVAIPIRSTVNNFNHLFM